MLWLTCLETVTQPSPLTDSPAFFCSLFYLDNSVTRLFLDILLTFCYLKLWLADIICGPDKPNAWHGKDVERNQVESEFWKWERNKKLSKGWMVFQILGMSMCEVERTLVKGLSQPRRRALQLKGYHQRAISASEKSTLAKGLSLEGYLSLGEAAGYGLTSSTWYTPPAQECPQPPSQLWSGSLDTPISPAHWAVQLDFSSPSHECPQPVPFTSRAMSFEEASIFLLLR